MVGNVENESLASGELEELHTFMSSLSVVFGHPGREWGSMPSRSFGHRQKTYGLFHFLVYARLQFHPNRNDVVE